MADFMDATRIDFLLDENKKLKKEQVQINDALQASLKLVQDQALDEGLWFVAERVTEAYLQQELRKLHQSVEDAWQQV